MLALFVKVPTMYCLRKIRSFSRIPNILRIAVRFYYISEKPWKSTFSITPLSFDAPSPGNPREYPHKLYIARN